MLYQVGYLSASIRTVADARVGDTITHHDRKADNSLPGYQEATPMVFCGLFPVDADQYWYLICTLFFIEQKQLYSYLLKWMSLESIISFFCSAGRFPDLRDALEKLQLNDAALKVGVYWYAGKYCIFYF